MLMIKYLGSPPFGDFYAGGLRATELASNALYGRAFGDLAERDTIALVETMSGSNPEGWEGPPAPFFYFVLRSDAVDVCYGTEQGFSCARRALYGAHPTPAALVTMMATPEKVDALIVGSGAAGSLLAARLAGAGKRTLVLEAGPARQNVGPGEFAAMGEAAEMGRQPGHRSR